MNCDLLKYEMASELGEKNVQLLKLIYTTSDSNGNSNIVEVAHELFKLAEIQCNCKKFRNALVNVNEAISIAENVYSADSKILREFRDLRQNILTIL